MWLKNIYLSKIIVFLLVLLSGTVLAIDKVTTLDKHQVRINVIYPKPDQIISAVDSTFILGNVPPESKKTAYKLFINNQYVDVHPEGGFIAFLPITPGDFQFELTAFLLDKKKYRYLSPQQTGIHGCNPPAFPAAKGS